MTQNTRKVCMRKIVCRTYRFPRNTDTREERTNKENKKRISPEKSD